MTSYVIARTLGVVDDVKASTSDADAQDGPGTNSSTADGGQCVAVAVSASAASAYVEGIPARGSDGLAPEDSVDGQRRDGDEHGYVSGAAAAVRVVAATAAASGVQAETGVQVQTPMRLRSADGMTDALAPPQTYYFAGEDHLGLAGDGVFSPAVSGPPSPLTPRMQLQSFSEGDGGKGSGEEEGIVLRRRVQGVREDEVVHT